MPPFQHPGRGIPAALLEEASSRAGEGRGSGGGGGGIRGGGAGMAQAVCSRGRSPKLSWVRPAPGPPLRSFVGLQGPRVEATAWAARPSRDTAASSCCSALGPAPLSPSPRATLQGQQQGWWVHFLGGSGLHRHTGQARERAAHPPPRRDPQADPAPAAEPSRAGRPARSSPPELLTKTASLASGPQASVAPPLPRPHKILGLLPPAARPSGLPGRGAGARGLQPGSLLNARGEPPCKGEFGPRF